jgi:hypothetical protein
MTNFQTPKLPNSSTPDTELLYSNAKLRKLRNSETPKHHHHNLFNPIDILFLLLLLVVPILHLIINPICQKHQPA